ncbi:MAG TPA: hypothetical protein VJ888_08825 [Mobilitalea sp.]|nr:hypothetical protein [Mobilitalea sp.]
MLFHSILGVNKLEYIEPEKLAMPRFFYDLNIDQIVQDIMEGHKLYDLRRFYYHMVDREDINYRLEVLKDFDNPNIDKSISDFSIGMRRAREYLIYIENNENEVQRQKWNLDSAFSYINSLISLQEDLDRETINSEGLQLFREWLADYIKSEEFICLKEETEQLTAQFEGMQFNIQLKRDRVIINTGYLEEDYCKQLQDTFREGSEDKHLYQKNPFGTPMLSALEGSILQVLSKPYAQTFLNLKEYDEKHHNFIHPLISEFELECQFYISFCRYRSNMKEMNFHFCYPTLSEEGTFRITKGYDLALAKKNASYKKEVIFNDCYFDKGERFFVITGPNQGGKTTFARAMGQMIYFSAIGLMVPAEEAEVPVFDGIYTHFAVEENINTGAGKLKEELLRLKEMMDNATRNSFVIINEVFTSATSYDAYIMGRKVLDFFMDMDCLGAYVTHIYELTKEDDRVVSLVAALLAEGSNIRTFKIERRPADGKSYANTIVEKHHLTYQEIKERIRG